MGDLKDWPLQFGENNSTHFRTSCSTKNEKMWSFWGLFDPVSPSDQCWILWLWSNLCICQHLISCVCQHLKIVITEAIFSPPKWSNSLDASVRMHTLCASFQSIPLRASSPSTPFNPCELPKDGKECVSFLMDFVRLSALENRMGKLKVRPGQFRYYNSTHFPTRPNTKSE